MHGRMATYRYSGDAHELAQRAEEGMLPIFRAQPGFKAYSLATAGDEIISLSVWDSAEQAEAANAAAAGWVAENMADSIELIDAKVGEVLLSTTLGVSATAGARA
jgi:heme-degrading monooxygenase HmoA